MKRIVIGLLGAVLLIVGAKSYAWNPFKKSSYNKLSSSIKSAANSVANETTKAANVVAKETTKAADATKESIVSVAQDTYKGMRVFGNVLKKEIADPVVDAGDTVIKKLKDCGEVVALGSEWAAKKAAYEAALGVLQATREMAVVDPRVFGQYAGYVAATAGLEAGKLSAQGIAKMMEGIGALAGGAFNITEVSFDAQATDLAAGKLPIFVLKGVFCGSRQTIKFQFDVKNAFESMNGVVKDVLHTIAIGAM